MSNIFRLSVSKSKTFTQCQKKYFYTYIEKLPRKSFSFHTTGKFCHKVLEDFHLALLNNCQDEFNKIMSDCFKSATEEFKKDLTKEMKKDCWDMINQYLIIMNEQKKTNTLRKVIACEKPFEIIIDEKVLVNGVIDKIQIDPDGVICVADYKTTKDLKYMKDDWFQLKTYAWVLYMQDSTITKVRGSYIMLRHNFKEISKDFTLDEILEVRDEYIKYTESITNTTEYKASPSGLCMYCDASDVCPSAQISDYQRNKLTPSNGEMSW